MRHSAAIALASISVTDRAFADIALASIAFACIAFAGIALPSMAFACFAFAGIAFAGIALASIALASMMMMLLRANDVMIHFPTITEPCSFCETPLKISCATAANHSLVRPRATTTRYGR
mgnify:CR=1 FL=1